MRSLALTLFAAGTLFAMAPTHAQTYDPNYPVCLHIYGDPTYYECDYTSLPQCNLSASGRAADCVVNPYFAHARMDRPAPHHHRRHYRVN